MASYYNLYTDGGASPNPGPTSASGVCITPSSTVVFAYSDYLGEATNNVGELTAILRGLTMALNHSITQLHVYSDSELSVNLCQKTKKTSKPHLQILVDGIHDLVPKFTEVRFSWIEAHNNHLYNEFADQLCTSMLQRVAELGATKPKANANTNTKPKSQNQNDSLLTLNCPFQEKDQVKAMGARWDAAKKKWTVQNTPENRERFEKWLS